MGLLGGLFTGDAPSLTTVPLDPGTQKLINDQYQHATQSNAQLANEANAGVGTAGNTIQDTAANQAQNNAKFGGVGFSDAIRNQYNQVAGKNIGQVIDQNNNMTSMRRAHYLQNASANMLAQQKVETQNYEMQMKAMMNAEQSRAQLLASVLGLAGTAGGMWAASRGPTPRHPKVDSTPAYDTNDMMENEGSMNMGSVG